MTKLFGFALGIICLATSYAIPAYAGEDQFFGTLTGATVGGIVGSQFGHGDGRIAGATVGVLAGGWLGNDIGYEMDNERSTSAASGSPGGYRSPTADMVARQTSQSNYMPNYVAPDDTLSPESVYADSCRLYSRQVLVNGQVQQNYGTACLQPDGTWRAVDQ